MCGEDPGPARAAARLRAQRAAGKHAKERCAAAAARRLREGAGLLARTRVLTPPPGERPLDQRRFRAWRSLRRPGGCQELEFTGFQGFGDWVYSLYPQIWQNLHWGCQLDREPLVKRLSLSLLSVNLLWERKKSKPVVLLLL